jgi:hypothetical protein
VPPPLAATHHTVSLPARLSISSPTAPATSCPRACALRSRRESVGRLALASRRRLWSRAARACVSCSSGSLYPPLRCWASRGRGGCATSDCYSSVTRLLLDCYFIQSCGVRRAPLVPPPCFRTLLLTHPPGSSPLLVPHPFWFLTPFGSSPLLVPHPFWFLTPFGSSPLLVPSHGFRRPSSRATPP